MLQSCSKCSELLSNAGPGLLRREAAGNGGREKERRREGEKEREIKTE